MTDTLPDPEWRVMRDGTLLFLRRYACASDVAIVALHAADDDARLHALGRSLRASGAASLYVVDRRGHGRSGGRRDAGDELRYEDDVADLVRIVRRERPSALVLVLGGATGTTLPARESEFVEIRTM